MKEGEIAMAKDPVCETQVEESKAAVRVDFKGKTYYLCSHSCKDKFVTEPKAYTDRSAKARP